MLDFITWKDEMSGDHFIRDHWTVKNSAIIKEKKIDLNLIHLSMSLVTSPFLILAKIYQFGSKFYFEIFGF